MIEVAEFGNETVMAERGERGDIGRGGGTEDRLGEEGLNWHGKAFFGNAALLSLAPQKARRRTAANGFDSASAEA